MSILDYFREVQVEKFNPLKEYQKGQLGHAIQTEITEISDFNIIIFNVEEDRGSINNKGCKASGNEIRHYFYQLFQGDYSIKIGDLGTIVPGSSITDTYFAVQESISYCLSKNVLPIVLGGSQDLVYANYMAYTKQEQMVNLVSIDSRFGLGEADGRINSTNFFSKIILQQPSILFNFSNLGYQTYLVNQDELALLNDLFFDSHRLGILKDDIKNAEPVIRNADILNFNLSAIAQNEAPANENTSPNGLSGQQACQLSRYAGMSDKLSSFGIYELNPNIDDRGQTAHLAAQMLWYFIDGFYNRKKDFPACNKKEYTKYRVTIDEGEQEIVFYKSPKSDRWWMEVPYNSTLIKKYERHLMLPCNYEDYITATENEIPERWFQTFKKLK